MGWRGTRIGCVLAAVSLVALSGCTTKPDPKEQKPDGPSGFTPSATDMTYAWSGFPQPCRTPADAKILVEKRVPAQVRPNQEYSFNIKITNRIGYLVNEISLQEQLPQAFEVSKVTPQADRKGDTLNWSFRNFKDGEVRDITVVGKVTRPGGAMYYGNPQLTFSAGGEISAPLDVIEPKLDFGVEAPKVVVIERNFPVKFTFRNGGMAPITGTKLVHTLPRGLLTDEGKSKVDLDVGDLTPGEAKAVDVLMRATEIGKYNITYEATADEGLSAKAQMVTEATRPRLEITGEAPANRYVGNFIPYAIELRNAGNAPADNTTVELALPDGVTLAFAGEGGQLRGTTVVWTFPNLAPNETKRILARVVAERIMNVRAVVTAKTLGAEPVSDVMVTDVAGIAALLGTLVDINDPVPVGENEIYEITIENQGSLPATGIRLKAVMPEKHMEFVKASGATKEYPVKGNEITFEPLAALAPGAEAKWRVEVKAIEAGDIRFRIVYESDQLERPVVIDESTHLYE